MVNMSDRVKTFTALLCFLAALILPLVGLLVGWWKWNVTTGIWMMVGIFLVLTVLGGLILLRVKDLSWLGVYLPYIFGAAYGFLPDLSPIALDDAAATTAGAIFSALLALHKKPGTPKWIWIPLLAAGIYALVGGFIPGPVDEFIVDAAALVVAWLGTRQAGDTESA
jgi:hypothetical protein